jgi:hypothetical protein
MHQTSVAQCPAHLPGVHIIQDCDHCCVQFGGVSDGYGLVTLGSWLSVQQGRMSHSKVSAQQGLLACLIQKFDDGLLVHIFQILFAAS